MKATRHTIRDVAERTGLSYSSVAKILRDAPGFNAQTRERVLDAAKSLGYRPDWIGKALRGGPTMSIGIVVYGRGTAISTQRVRAMERAAGKQAYRSYLVHVDPEAETDLLGSTRDLMDRRVDGILVVGAEQPFLGHIAGLIEASGLCHVFADFGPPAADNVVAVDRESGIREVVEHLREANVRRVGLLAGQVEGSSRLDPKEALYRNALTAAGIGIAWTQAWTHRGDQLTSMNMPEAYARVRKALTAHPTRPEVIIATNDSGAMAALAAVRDQGMAIPDDIGVIGFDGLEFTAMTRPALTTVRQPTTEVGVAAFDMLLNLMREPGAAVSPIQFPCMLLVRDSTPSKKQPLVEPVPANQTVL